MVPQSRILLFVKATVNEPLLKHQERGVEWFSAFCMCAWAYTLAAPGDTFSRQSFSEFVSHGYTEELVAAIFAAVGVMRLIALFINGSWPRSPLLRIFGAAVGIVLWTDVAYLLYMSSLSSPGKSPGPWMYAILAAFEVGSVYRATFDARYRPKVVVTAG